MSKEIEISLLPELAFDESAIRKAISEYSGLKDLSDYRIIRRSIDARHRQVKFILKLALFQSGEIPPLEHSIISYDHVIHPKGIMIIVGAGPAGLFAALKAIELGWKPVVIERGKDVRERRRDLAAIHKEHIVNPDSNYCFGEGGAGTYSDGKLYTRSTKRGDVGSVLETLVQFGASEEILIDAHPHIGTNKLPSIIASIRNQIIECGGEFQFNTRITDISLDGNKIECLISQSGDRIKGDAYVFATGHSARDIYSMLLDRGIEIEFKPFALGVRVEHPQSIIDREQYHCEVRPALLPPAAYSLVHQVNHRGVYSFCMCPGGIMAPCATAQDEIVTNGWSPSKRNNPWANSGIVVPVHYDDIIQHHASGQLAGMNFQKEVEHKAWLAGGKTQTAPAQRLIDFVENRTSSNLPNCSYQPGIVSVNLNLILPEFISHHLREGLKAFGKKMKGYYTNDAVLVAPESRTSSPVRIPRDKESLKHIRITNLYPCGEGAGYAGGIVSAAIDGQKVASMIAVQVHNK